MKLLQAGKLKNLNDLVVGASVLNADGKLGYVLGVSEKCTLHGTDDIVGIRADIEYPGVGMSFHSYRHDGRSTHDAEHDIVKVSHPENSKVKSIKIWSDQPLNKKIIDKGNEIALIAKACIDTEKKGKGWVGTKKTLFFEDFEYKVSLGKSGQLSVKVNVVDK